MKDVPKRAGDVVDRICSEAGIDKRLHPGSTVLHKSEAVVLLSYLITMKSRMKQEGGSSNGKSD